MLTRRALSVLLSLVLLFSLLPAPVRAEDDLYSFDASTGTLSILKSCSDASFNVNDDAVRYVRIASGVGALPSGGSVFFRFPNLIAIEVDDGNSYYFAQDGVLMTKNYVYGNESQELRSYTLISYPRGKTDPFTVPEKADEVLADAFKEVTGATIYVSRGVDNYVVDKLQKLGSGFAVVSLGGTVSAASVELRQNGSAVPAGQSFTLNIGGELAFSASVSPASASQEVFWTSSDPAVVTVNSSGTVTAISAGTATLTVSTAELVDNQHLTASCTVTVRPEPTGVTISGGDAALRPGDKTTLTAAVRPVGALQDVTWSSGDSAVATVDSNTGEVTAVASGEAVITATSARDTGISATKTITVTPVKVQTLTLNHDALTVEVTDTAQLTATAAPADAADKSVSWASSNEAVATVDSSGKVTAVAMGEATVTATAKDGSGVTASCVVTVPEAKINALTMNIATLKLRIDSNQTAAGSHTLTVTFDPAYASYKDLTWQSLNTNVATVTADPNDPTRATVTAVDSGTVTILASSSHGKNQETVTASCAVTVEKAADSLTVTPEDHVSLIINGGEGEDSVQYTAAVPAGTTDSVEWSSNNEAIAQVDGNGKVTALDNGEAIITARCGSLSATRSVSVTVRVSGITLNQTALSLPKGSTAQLTAGVAPANAKNKTLTWASSAPNVVSVDENGLVTALATSGEATITAAAQDGSGVKATCTVTAGPVTVTGVTVAPARVTLEKGGTETLTATVAPENATDKSVSWSSSNTDVATVDANGAVTAKGAGSAAITARTNDGGFTASCAVTVTVTSGGVSLNLDSLTLRLGAGEAAKTAQLTAVADKADATSPVEWASKNTDIVTVSAPSAALNGGKATVTLTAVKAGRAYVTATVDGKTALCQVTVRQAAGSLTLSHTDAVDLTVNGAAGADRVQLTATVSPEDVTDPVVWGSDNTGAATVSQTGLVTGVGNGTAHITAACGEKTATVTVNVKVRVAEITLNKTELTLPKGSSETLRATVLPGGAENAELEWSSSDDTVATVDENGAVTAVAAEGAAVITAAAKDGSGVKATCTVEAVPVAVTGVSVSPAGVTLEKGGTKELTATVAPTNATNQSVSWSSSNTDVATVSETGIVTAVGPGTATITVTTASGNKTATCAVTITLSASEVSLSSGDLILRLGAEEAAKTATLTATVTPGNSTSKVQWSSNDVSVVTVSESASSLNADGTATVTLRAVRAGNADVTATIDGHTAVCHVKVEQAAGSLVVTPASKELVINGDTGADSVQLTADVPEGTTDAVTWTSDNVSVATVSGNNRTATVTAVGKGSAVITATCGDKTDTAAITVKVLVSSVRLNKDTLSLVHGDSETLTATVAPAGVSDASLVWESSDEQVATVDQNGKVTAVATSGTAAITAKAQDDSHKSASCTVTALPIAVTGVSVTPQEVTLKAGETRQLSATVTPEDATDKSVSWTSSNEAVATVSADGLVTADGPGMATIAATAGGSKTAECAVTVTRPAESVVLDNTALTLRLGGASGADTAGLTATVTPNDATSPVLWSSSDPAIVTASAPSADLNAQGKATVTLTAVKAGRANVIATIDGKPVACQVTVEQAADSLSVTALTSADLVVNGAAGADRVQLTAAVEPDNTTDPIVWSSNNTGAATVDQTGLVIARGNGEAIITATCGSMEDSITVTAAVRVSEITLDKTAIDLVHGDSVTLRATVLPAGAKDRSLTWESSNTAVATVDAYGVVRAVAPEGSATITATARDGSGKSAQCEITAKPIAVTGFLTLPQSLTLKTGETGQVSASVDPANATDPVITWSSSDGNVATVNADTGEVTAVGPGSAAITAATRDGGFTASCTVTVTLAASDVSLSSTDLTLRLGEGEAARTATLTATVTPNNTTSPVEWASGNTNIVTVSAASTALSGGKATVTLTAVSAGDANVTATVDGKTAVCRITVEQAAGSLRIEPIGDSELEINGAENRKTFQLSAVAGDTTDTVTWSSNNESVATVSSGGLVTAVGKGSAVITARCGQLTATHTVNVTVLPVSVTLNKNTLSLVEGGSETLTATVAPAGVSNSAVTWSSNNESVATVSSSGLVTAVGPGTATITVTTASGSKTATCAVTVTPALSGLSLSDTALTLRLGAANGTNLAPLTATVTPANAATAPVGFVSSKPDVVTVSSASVAPDAEGKAVVTLTARKAGDAVITVSVGGQTAFCDVTVEQAAAGLSLPATLSLTLHGAAGTESGTLTATLTPGDATDALTWSCENASVCTVSGSGKSATVTAVSAGRATVTATADSGATASCTVTVGDRQIASLSLPETLDVYLNGSGAYPASNTLTLSVSPADTTGSILWTNGNPDAVRLSEPVYTTAGNTRLGTVTVTAVGGGKSVISVAADNGRTASCTVSVKVLATGVTLDQSALSLEQNATAKLTASLAPVTVTNPALTWSSDNESVATVSGGVVTAVAPGIAHITAAATDGSGKVSEACTVTVTEIAVTGVRLTPQRLVMRVGDTPVSLSAAVTPANAANTAVSWISSNNNVATVNDSGAVTAVGPGEAEITVKTTDGNFTAVCYVTVAATPVTSLTLDRTSMDVLLREVTDPVTLTATVLPDKATDKSVVWSSSNETVATVVDNSDGTAQVTLRAVGSAVITARSVSNGTVYRVCPVTVRPTSVEAVSLSAATLELEPGGTANLAATLTSAVENVPPDNTAVTWSSSNPNVATVDSSGHVTAVASGSAAVTVLSAEGGKSATCLVKVWRKVTGVTLSSESLSLNIGESRTLTATVDPSDAENRNLRWSSSNEAVAAVDAAGRVVARSAGTATVTVTTEDQNKTDTCDVIVSAVPVESVSLSAAALTLRTGETRALLSAVSPAGATNGAVTWSSSDPGVVSVSAGGMLTANSSGSATITAEADGQSATCAVTVYDAPTGVTLTGADAPLSLEVGNTAALGATVLPNPGAEQSVSWESSNSAVASVANGTVTAVANGTAVITAAAGQHRASVTVTVVRGAQGVTLDKDNLSFDLSTQVRTAVLTAALNPGDTTERPVWTVSGSAAQLSAAATENGESSVTVYAVSEGTATVTVTLGTFSATCDVTVANPATGVVLDNAALTLTRGRTKQLVATVLSADATDPTVTWESSDETVATVSGGLVNAVSAGTATVTATANGHSAQCLVTVEPVKVSAVTMDNTALTLTVGGSEMLTTSVTPNGADNRELLWESGNDAVAFVDQTGQITARGVGTAIVTATAKDGSGSFAACLVTVEPVAVTGFATEPPATLSLTENESRQLSAAVNADATDQALRWHSSNETVATVDANGNVTAHSAGTAILTVTAHGDESKTASCTVTVTAPLTGLSLPAALSLKTEETATLSPVFTPGNASNTAVTWRSGNENIATVDANGAVTAVGPGTVNITVTAAADNSKTAACAVTVTRSVTGVTLADAATPLTLDMSATATLTATVAPSDASDKTLSWSSTNPAVATVANGIVTPVAPGTTAILVTTADGGFFASRTVKVVRAASGVTLTPTNLSLAVGRGAQLTAAVTGDATDTGIRWDVTSDPAGAVAVTDSGYVTALHAGAATVTATATDGSDKTAACAVTVYEPVSAVAIQKAGATVTSLTLNLVTGRTAQLTAVPTGGTPTLQWSAEGDAVTVDDSGLVTAQKAGTAVVTVTATTQDVSVSARCAVTVEKAILTADKTAMVLTPQNSCADAVTFSPWLDGSTLSWGGATGSVIREPGELSDSNKSWKLKAVQNGVYTVSWLRSGDNNYEASGGELTIYAVPHPITAVSLTTAGAAVASVDQQERRINIAGTYTGDAKPAYTLSYTLATDVLGTLSYTVNGNSVTVQNGDDTVCEYTIVDNRAALPENVTVSTQVSLMAAPGKVVDSGSVDITDAAAANLNAAAVGKVVEETGVTAGDVQVTLKLEKSVATESGNQVLKLEILPTYTTTAGASGELHTLDAAVEISVTVNFKPTLIVHRHVEENGSVSYEYPNFTATPTDESESSYMVTWWQKRFSMVDLLPAEAAAAYMESLNTTLPPETPEEAEQPGDHTDDSTGDSTGNKPGDNTAGSKETGAGNNSTGSSGGITGGGGVHNGSASGSASRKPAEPAAPATAPTVPATPAVPEPKADNVRSFLDVPESHWAREAIAYVSERGIINGMSPKTFAPELSASRAMIAQILCNLDGGAKESVSPFPDTAGKWFDAAAAWAAAKGVVNGVGGRFDGDTPVTREQLAVMLYRYAALIGKATGDAAGLSRFRDADTVSPWAAEAMAWAVGRGLINGVSPATLAPRAGATRAQTAAILMRFCENVLK